MAGGRVELQSSCQVLGVIHARPSGLKLEEGARFNGRIEMLEDEQAGTPEEVDPGMAVNALEALKGLSAPTDTPGEDVAEEDELRASSVA